MLVLALNPGHDGAAAAVEDGKLVFSLESEKDSYARHAVLTPSTLLDGFEMLGGVPDIVALSGWVKEGWLGNFKIGSGYHGSDQLAHRAGSFFGKQAKLFTSSHERSHIAMAIGMAPRDDAPVRAVLCWEGDIGSFYLVDERWAIIREIPVMTQPGGRYSFLYALADSTVPDRWGYPRLEDSGKLMALAAYAKPSDADPEVVDTVERIIKIDSIWPAPKHEFLDSPIYNAGVEADVTKAAAALLTQRIFEVFANAAQEHLPRDIPLHISGGCGLNCDWNYEWRELGYFSSVFVPPCTNDSGSALGTALDALMTLTGDPYIDWDVYSGLEFEWDCAPDPRLWTKRDLRLDRLVDVLARGGIVAWIQGRWEIGPRALGNRSILAEPFSPGTRDRLNVLKKREAYRPIAPCCRLEDAGKIFTTDFEDPYMLYFRLVRSNDFGAITHVDGSARAQTVTRQGNKPLYDLLSAFAERRGFGLLCNTSLNFKGFGFINRMSDLAAFCERQGISDMVVGDAWFQRVETEAQPAPAELTLAVS